ncbi:hypothetical protein JG687_00012036 [Phytophthora cactorum]|uniref:Uncharacterized protein n=1 Tax=Phytophthora cactorum TaxID=29920 RepID=A0A8T1U6N6_9STRA|nr:hypothetical protein JG687_00012036 [Phytophthora cactorum]
MESLRSSRTAEVYHERGQLLTGCLELTKPKKNKNEAARREAASNQVVRDAMVGVRRAREEDAESKSPSSKNPKRTSTEAIVAYRESKAEDQPSRDKQRQRQLTYNNAD